MDRDLPIKPGGWYNEHFWNRLDKTTSQHGCWLWPEDSLDRDCYGRISIQGSRNPKQTSFRANVVAWLLANGLRLTPEETPHVLHKCSGLYKKRDITYRRCCNPDHLYAGTPQQNSDDMSREDRAKGINLGELNGQAQLTKLEVQEIRLLRHTEQLTYKQLGLRFGVSPLTVRSILLNKIWTSENYTKEMICQNQLAQGTLLTGESNGNAILDWIQVREIRFLKRTEHSTHKILAERFDVSVSLISNIISNKVWKEEKDPANLMQAC